MNQILSLVLFQDGLYFDEISTLVLTVSVIFMLKFHADILCICNFSVFQARLLTIACQEGFRVDRKELDEITEAAEHDVRQSIYNLQMLSTGGNGKEIQSKDAAVVSF